VKEVILFSRKEITEKEDGLWDTDKRKIRLHRTEAKNIIKDMRVVRKKGLYDRSSKKE